MYGSVGGDASVAGGSSLFGRPPRHATSPATSRSTPTSAIPIGIRVSTRFICDACCRALLARFSDEGTVCVYTNIFRALRAAGGQRREPVGGGFHRGIAEYFCSTSPSADAPVRSGFTATPSSVLCTSTSRPVVGSTEIVPSTMK